MTAAWRKGNPGARSNCCWTAGRNPWVYRSWAFTPAIFPLLADHFRRFLAAADTTRDEWYLPAVVGAAVRAGRAEVLVVPAPDPWCGMTWPGDWRRVAARLADNLLDGNKEPQIQRDGEARVLPPAASPD